MDPEIKHATYDTSLFKATGSALMKFEPINAIHQHLCAFHSYSGEPLRQVEAHHFCTHLSADFHQCVIYDSEGPNAKLIGIEYIISEKLFSTLAKEERAYWHSHKYEVESGLLQLHVKDLVPGQIADLAEQPAMLELQKTYGKTIHTWSIDTSPDLPLGPPALMMSFTGDGQVREDLVRSRDERTGESTEKKRSLRQQYLPRYEKVAGSDEWEESGKAIVIESVRRSVKSPAKVP